LSTRRRTSNVLIGGLAAAVLGKATIAQAADAPS
jgi:hypothetical protein